jgi:MFS-type transporter involved in bile tolerance (Atg22 family)
MLIADSVTTLQIYLTLYLKNAFNFTDKMSSLAGVISLGMLFLTCMLLGSLAHRIVNKQKLLGIAGMLYAGTFLLFGLTPNVPLLVYLSLALGGIAYGLFFPLARSLYSDIAPKEEQSEYFSLFVIFERAAAIVGPLVWVIVYQLLFAYPTEFRYRANLIMLSIIAVVGLYLLKKSSTLTSSFQKTDMYSPQ